MSNTYLYLLIALLAGGMMPTQAGTNNKMAAVLGSPILAAFISFFVGTVALFAYALLSGESLSAMTEAKNAPPIAWIGGPSRSMWLVGRAGYLPKGLQKTNKNDVADTEAICEAVRRPSMRFVPIKSVEQQAVLAVHRLRQGLVEERTALINRLRGLLAEYGLIVGAGPDRLRKALPTILEDAANGIPGIAREAFADAGCQLAELDARVGEYDRRIAALARINEPAQRLMKMDGVGRSPPRQWWPASAMPRYSRMVASSPPGSDSRHDSIPPAASSVSAS